MSFANTTLLWSLIAIAIPILIHLFSFRKTKTVFFSSIQFLKQLQKQTSTKSKLKHFLLLSARILGLVFMILAFCLPFFDTNSKRDLPQKISIWIDNSESNNAKGKTGTVLEESKQAAFNLVKAAKKSDKFQILTNALNGKELRWISKEQALEKISAIGISANPVKISALISIQNEEKSINAQSNFNAFWFSDFQKSHFEQVKEWNKVKSNTKLIQQEVNPAANLSVDSAWFTSPVFRVNQAINLVTKVTNNGAETSSNTGITVFVNGLKKGILAKEIQPGQTALDTFVFTTNTSGWNKVEVQVDETDLIFDNKYFLTFKIDATLKCLILSQENTSKAIMRFFENDPYLLPSFYNVNTYALGNLNAFNSIVLDRITNLSSGLSSELTNWVKTGGNLVIFPNAENNVAALNAFCNNFGFNVEALATYNLKNQPNINWNDENPILKEIFQENKIVTQPLYAQKAFIVSPITTAVQYPFLNERNSLSGISTRLGTGWVHFWGVDISPELSQISQNGVFAPFLYRTVLNTPFFNIPPFVLGKKQQLSLPNSQLKDRVFELSKNGEIWIPELKRYNEYAAIVLPSDLNTPGFYMLNPQQKSDTTNFVLGFNVASDECILKYPSESEMNDWIKQNKLVSFYKISNNQSITAIEADSYWPLWKVFLIFAIAMFLIEQALIIFIQ